jgi:hypothetical protein
MISPADMVSRGIHTASTIVRPKTTISESKPVQRKKIRVAKKDKPPATLTHIETPDKINKALAMMQIGEDVALEAAVKKNVEKFEKAISDTKYDEKKEKLLGKVKAIRAKKQSAKDKSDEKQGMEIEKLDKEAAAVGKKIAKVEKDKKSAAHTVKGSEEAKAWGEKMKLAREKKKGK